MAMTETTIIEQEAPGLLRHAFYSHHGAVLLAVDEEHLIDILGTGDTQQPALPETTLVEVPGSAEWILRMVRVRDSLSRSLQSLQQQRDERIDHWQRFGEAVLVKAEEMSWCEEYDNFADEWGLPSRVKEFDVTISVRISARNEEEALEIAAHGISLDSYGTDGVVSGPEYDVNAAY